MVGTGPPPSPHGTRTTLPHPPTPPLTDIGGEPVLGPGAAVEGGDGAAGAVGSPGAHPGAGRHGGHAALPGPARSEGGPSAGAHLGGLTEGCVPPFPSPPCHPAPSRVPVPRSGAPRLGAVQCPSPRPHPRPPAAGPGPGSPRGGPGAQPSSRGVTMAPVGGGLRVLTPPSPPTPVPVGLSRGHALAPGAKDPGIAPGIAPKCWGSPSSPELNQEDRDPAPPGCSPQNFQDESPSTPWIQPQHPLDVAPSIPWMQPQDLWMQTQHPPNAAPAPPE